MVCPTYFTCRAKAAVANMEFVQFHPTSLYRPACPAPLLPGGAAAELAGGRSFLITEAVRGEGGMLYNLGELQGYPAWCSRKAHIVNTCCHACGCMHGLRQFASTVHPF